MSNRRRYDTILLVASVFVLLGTAILAFLGISLQNSNQETLDLRFNLLEQNLRRDRYQDLLTSYIEIKEEGVIEELENLLPSASEFVSVIESLEQYAATTGNQMVLSLDGVSLTSEGFEISDTVQQSLAVTTRSNFSFVVVEVSIQGNYSQMLEFVSSIQSSRYYMNILNVRMNRIQREGMPPAIVTTMDVQVYVKQLLVPLNAN